MATEGFEVYDANGKLQADTSFFTYSLRRSGTGVSQSRSIGGGNTNPSTCAIPIPGNYVAPLVALSCQFNVAPYAYGGSAQSLWVCSGPIGTAFTYYVFDRSDGITPGHFGLELFNASGVLTWSSNYHPMQALGLIGDAGPFDSSNNRLGNAGGYPMSFSAAGKTLALAQGAMGGHRHFDGNWEFNDGGGNQISNGDGQPHNYFYLNNGKLYGGSVSIDGTSVAYGEVSYDDVDVQVGDVSNPQASPERYWPMLAFAVDVTNYPIGGADFF